MSGEKPVIPEGPPITARDARAMQAAARARDAQARYDQVMGMVGLRIRERAREGWGSTEWPVFYRGEGRCQEFRLSPLHVSTLREAGFRVVRGRRLLVLPGAFHVITWGRP